ncbi:MAG: hypothetical protein HY909_17085 [Deltaproteobacteria bacterium]|nr:hypothetical protein [Deltaproteobacteria bacterium]
MRERNCSEGDVRSALATATGADPLDDGTRWRVVGGLDRGGDELTVVVAVEFSVVVITVY